MFLHFLAAPFFVCYKKCHHKYHIVANRNPFVVHRSPFTGRTSQKTPKFSFRTRQTAIAATISVRG